MNLVLIRHATRSGFADFGADDMPLNPVGLAQAEDLATAVVEFKTLPHPTALFTSPKLRARQTLMPLARASSLPIEVMADLDEREQNESRQDFEKRIQRSFEKLLKRFSGGAPDETIFVCTHLDVLEAAVVLWPTDLSEREMQKPWSTLEFQVFAIQDGILKADRRGRIDPRV